MKLPEFTSLINAMCERDDKHRAACEIGIDLTEWSEPYLRVERLLMKAAFGETGEEWVSWFCYENDYGREELAAEDNGKPICYDIESLWKHISASV